MPAQPTSTQSRLDNIIRHSTAALNTLEVLARFLETPFLESISKTVRSLLTAAENIKQNKSDCFQLLEQTHQLLSAIVSLHIKSTSGFDLPLSMLNHLGKFTDTLYKVHTYVEAQQDKNKFRQFFRQGEMNTLLKACNDGLHEAFDVFMLHNIDDLANIADVSKFAEDRHQEVLQLIETLSEDDMSSKGSLRMFSMFHNSSTSISMLPAEPKIFHGRESELSDLVKLFIQEQAPRVAILGAGGIGKTSLAKAVLHHPQITDKFKEHRFFVVCDSVSTKAELASLIGAHFGLKPGKDLIRPIMHFLSSHSGCLLILDNLEALWEPLGNRRDIEEFLSCLTDVQHLALLITMRGTERPAKVHWTRPFFPSLKPLSREAARETFIDIVDDGYAQEQVDQVLLLTDNMPLAVNLMAHLVDSEGCSKVLSRWEKETTSVMSDGYDKQSNLDLSISLSITSPRIRSSPGAQDLLSLISMLPDGISDVELLQSRLPIANILGCKATLLATSLAYADENQQLKALKPICEHMQKFHPPKAHIVQALLEHCHVLLDFYMKYEGRSTTSGIIAHISSKHANIQNILLYGLQPQNPKLADTIYSICYLQRFAGISHRKHSPLIDHVPKLLRQSDDHRLQLYFISELLHSNENIISNHEVLIEQALEHVPHVDDSDVKCR
ncbi:P-loop containing nucleoside triphosphate hydrolase protein [Mycena crocata]|nr:P-loop containing nucleoside triphosphate hydrolase protein [Mycena crocata]